jgi:hypothetical protein
VDQGPSIAERYLYLTHDPETVVPLLSIAFALLVLVILYVAYAARGFAAYAGDLRQRLAAAQFDTRVEEIAPPPPLMRDFALRNGGRPGGPGLIEVRQTAELATAPGKSFFPLRARQTTGTRRAGFVWTASGTMPPGIPVSGLDAYVEGAGDFEIRIGGAVRVARAHDREAAIGELARYLAELPFYPDAILNAGGLAWRQLDERRVEVVAESNFGPVRVVFIFDAAGDIVAIEAERPREVGGRSIPTPWRGTFSQYRAFGSHRLPAHGEVGWLLPEGLFIYWKGDIVSYEPADDPRGSIRSQRLP